MATTKKPPEKHALNMLVTQAEFEFLKSLARRDGVTVTIAVRRLVWEAITRESGKRP